jgi:uncharacterized membrane protein YtjA (UPF0391 family)
MIGLGRPDGPESAPDLHELIRQGSTQPNRPQQGEPVGLVVPGYPEESPMTLLKWAFFALIVAAIAALFGFSGVAEGAVDVAQFLVVLFLVIAAVLGVLGVIAYRKVT